MPIKLEDQAVKELRKKLQKPFNDLLTAAEARAKTVKLKEGVIEYAGDSDLCREYDRCYNAVSEILSALPLEDKLDPSIANVFLDAFGVDGSFILRRLIEGFRSQFGKYIQNYTYFYLNDTREPHQQKITDYLPFFNALDPTSRKSGIVYRLAYGHQCQGTEMLDLSVSENIKALFTDHLNYFEKLIAIFNSIVGTHYDIYIAGSKNCEGGAKGIIDYLVFPLVARKLIADTYLGERKESRFSNALAWSIAIPLEITRFSTGVALTLLMTPIVALISLIQTFLPEIHNKARLAASS